MTIQSVRGRFIWHELMTRDRDKALSFYAESLGWKGVPWDLDPSYSMFAAPSGPLGGAVVSDEAPCWLPYVATAALDATLAEAERRGGVVVKAPTHIPNGSRYAVLADPQGALFAAYEPGEEPPPEAAPGQGDFSWHELAALDWRAAFDFYSALFGWERMAEHDMGPMGIYLLFGRNGAQIGGMFDKGEGGTPGDAYWLGYVSVADVQQTVDKIKGAGGTLAVGPMQVPGGAWIAQCIDPEGALFAVHAAPAAQAAPQGEAAAAETPAVEATEGKRTAASGAARPRKKTAATSQPASKKKPARKKSAGSKKSGGRKKAAAKKSGKKAAKKTAKKTGKKTAKKTTRKIAKKTAKKAGKKAAKKTAKKAAKKKTGGKKAGAKKAGKRSTAKTAGGKKTGKRSAAKTASKRAGRKKARGAGKRSGARKKASRRLR